MSLKEILKSEIQTMGVVPYSRIVSLCLEEGSKISAGERRLREIVKENPHFKAVLKQSKKGSWYVGEYRYEPSNTLF